MRANRGSCAPGSFLEMSGVRAPRRRAYLDGPGIEGGGGGAQSLLSCRQPSSLQPFLATQLWARAPRLVSKRPWPNTLRNPLQPRRPAPPGARSASSRAPPDQRLPRARPQPAPSAPPKTVVGAESEVATEKKSKLTVQAKPGAVLQCEACDALSTATRRAHVLSPPPRPRAQTLCKSAGTENVSDTPLPKMSYLFFLPGALGSFSDVP